MLATFASKLGPIKKKRCHLVSQRANRGQKLPIQSNYKGVCLFPQNEKKIVIKNVQIKFRRVSRHYCLLLGISTVATASKNDTINISAYNFTVMVFTSSLFCCRCLIKKRQNLTAIACIGSFHWLSVPWATNSTDS